MSEDNKEYDSTEINNSENPQQFYFEGYFDSAYSMPADADTIHSFRIKSSAAPPAFPPQYYAKPIQRRPVRVLPLVIIVSALMLAAALLMQIAVRFDFEIRQEDGNINISMIRRVPKNLIRPAYETEPARAEVVPTASLQGVLPPPAVYEWNGESMQLAEYPAENDVLSYQQIYKKCIGSVVSVYAANDRTSRSGTGVILSGDGFIITNNHLVEDCLKVTVIHYGESGDETEYGAVLVGKDAATDIAVLKIDARDLNPAEFGKSEYVEVGDNVLAIGNPLNQTLTVTDGIISAINRKIKYNGFSMTLLQTNAAINEGNSGGPLINRFGQVVGITNMKMFSSFSPIEGMGFAIPMNIIKPVIDQILIYGYVPGRPSLGIKVQDIPLGYAAYREVPRGVYVTEVSEVGEPRSALMPGDLIVEADGKAVSGQNALNETVNALEVGDTVRLKIFRHREYLYVDAQLVDASEFD